MTLKQAWRPGHDRDQRLLAWVTANPDKVADWSCTDGRWLIIEVVDPLDGPDFLKAVAGRCGTEGVPSDGNVL